MRRRRSRLPLILLGCLALLVGVSIGVVTSGRSAADLFGLVPAASPTPSASGGDTATAGSGSPVASEAPSGGASPAADSGTPASPGPSDASASDGAGATPSPSGPTGSGGASSAPSAGPSSAPSPGTASGAAKPVYNGSRAKKVVALTFDDGYSPVALREILAILKQEHVTATFFPYGWAVHQDPEGWHMVAAAGYPIGNHTLRHTILTSVTPAQAYEEMTRGRATIDLYSGAKSVNLMRPPGGAFNAPVAKEIARAGYPTMVLWDVDTFDWQGPSADTIYQRAIKGTNGSIVLMHSGPLNTPKALPRIIANYRARGFTFVTVPQLLGTS